MPDTLARPDALQVARLLLQVLCALATIGAAGVIVLRQTGIQSNTWFIALVAMTPYVVLLAGLGATCGALARSPWWTIAAVFVFGCAFVTQWPVVLPARGGESHVTADSLVVLTANVDGDRGDLSQLLESISEANPDVVALEAFNPYQLEQLTKLGFDERFPYRAVDLGRTLSGTGIWSRYPLKGTQYSSGLFWPQVVTQLDTPQLGTVEVVAVHSVSPRPHIADLWARDQDRLFSLLDAQPGPTISLGDFNATNDHALLRRLRAAGYTDSAEDVGAGVQRTWPAVRLPFPLIGIDHVLMRGGLVATEARVLPAFGSDHRPLMAVLTRR